MATVGERVGYVPPQVVKAVKKSTQKKTYQKKKTPLPGEREFLGKGEEEETREELGIPEEKPEVMDAKEEKVWVSTGTTKISKGGKPKEYITPEQYSEEVIVPWQQAEEEIHQQIQGLERDQWYDVQLGSGETVRWHESHLRNELEKQLELIREGSTEAQLSRPSAGAGIVKKYTTQGIEYSIIPRDTSLDWSKSAIESIERIPPPLYTFKSFMMMGLGTASTFASVGKPIYEWATGEKLPHYVTGMDVALEPVGLAPPGSSEMAKRMGVWGGAGTILGEAAIFTGIGVAGKTVAKTVTSASKWYIKSISSAYGKFTKWIPDEKLIFRTSTYTSRQPSIWGKVYRTTEKIRWGIHRFETKHIGSTLSSWARGESTFAKTYPLKLKEGAKETGRWWERYTYEGFGKRVLIPSDEAARINARIGQEVNVFVRGTPMSGRFESTITADSLKVQGWWKKTITDTKSSIRARVYPVYNVQPYGPPLMKWKIGQVYYFSPTKTITKGRPMISGGIHHTGYIKGVKTISMPTSGLSIIPISTVGYGFARGIGFDAYQKSELAQQPVELSLSANLLKVTPIQAEDMIQMQKQIQRQSQVLRQDTITLPISTHTGKGPARIPRGYPMRVKPIIPFKIPEWVKEPKIIKPQKGKDWFKSYRERTWKTLTMKDILGV